MAEYRLNFRYFTSHDANVDVSCEVTRLELPVSSDPDDPDASLDEPLAALAQGTEIYVTAHVACNGEVLHAAPVSTYNPCSLDQDRRCLHWLDLLSFPVRFKDLSRDATLTLTVWGGKGGGKRPLAGTTLGFFDHLGLLKTGKQKLRLYPGVAGDCHVEGCRTWGDDYSRRWAKHDLSFQIEKAREAYDFNQVPPVEWLDRLSLPHMKRVLHDLSTDRKASSSTYWQQQPPQGGGGEGYDGGLLDHAFLIVTLPIFHLPVLYEEKPYPGVGLPFFLPPTASSSSSSSLANKLAAGAAQELCVLYDWEAEADVNPVEAKYRKLAHDQFRGIRDPSLKPNKEERERIEAIVASPSDHLRMEDKDLLWTFQASLTDNKKALTKFLLSVDWAVEQEVEQVPALLEQWRQKTSIDLSDALKLLGREKSFQQEMVRAFAVDVLRRASDQDITTYLLQLVQALRYETRPGPVSSTGGGGTMGEAGGAEDEGAVAGTQPSMLARFLIERAVPSLELSNFLNWYLRVELYDATCGDMFKAVYDEFHRTLASRNEQLYHLLCRQEAFIHKIAVAQRKAREEKGRRDSKEEKLRKLLAAEPQLLQPEGGHYIPIPLDPTVQVTGVVPQTAFMFKSAMYPAVIQFNVYQGSSSSSSSAGDGSTASNTSASTTSTSTSSGTVKKGGGLGQKLDRLLGGGNSNTGANEQVLPPPPSSSSSSYKVIFKTGDDLRQDQLIMQMITLMDQLLKRVNLDLKLTPYRILATGPRDGLLEFVSGSLPVSEVLSQHNSSILEFLRHHNPDPSAPLGVSGEAMSTYVKSCAGYCVITYILGIGDRHLDNIMMLPAGNLFHIDFGFIFGNDPKPLPPPFRFTREMADAMGGEQHENFTRFKRYACQAYNCFRENANLLLNLLGLMVDAGIKDLSAGHQIALTKIEEKFRLDLTVEQAEHNFVSLISESLSALAPIIYENLHRIAVGRR